MKFPVKLTGEIERLVSNINSLSIDKIIRDTRYFSLSLSFSLFQISMKINVCS